MSRFRVCSPLGTSGFAALLALTSLVTFQTASANDKSALGSVPERIEAQYSIALGAFNLGHFNFEQRRRGQRYALKSVVELSALLGAFEWRGITETSGVLAAGSARPERYAFDYRSKGRGGMVRMAFEKGDVVELSALPSSPAGGAMVPLKEHHTRNVLDPLSAILTLSQPTNNQPCNRTLPIFDGKQRFNLTFKMRGTEALAGARHGQARGIVCQIKYKPIGGYVANSDTRKYAAENNIEIAFRPIQGGRVMVPYRLTLPTVIGTARLDLRKLSVGAHRSRVASVRQ